MEEGEAFEPVKKVAEVVGAVNNLLVGERVALNLLARASGIATRFWALLLVPQLFRITPQLGLNRARRMKELKEAKGWHGVVAGTRKTTPGERPPFLWLHFSLFFF